MVENKEYIFGKSKYLAIFDNSKKIVNNYYNKIKNYKCDEDNVVLFDDNYEYEVSLSYIR